MFGRKVDNTAKTATTEKKIDLNKVFMPIVQSSNHIMAQKNKLVAEELITSESLQAVTSSFVEVKRQSREINDSVVHFRDEFDDVRKVLNHFEEIIDKMLGTVNETHQSMNNVRVSSQSVNETIKAVQEVFEEFQKSFDEILEKVNAINGIANQTNLLALNASIEAARAGESGRGFAVVADQVNKLSSDIKTLVGSIGDSMDRLNQNNSRLMDSIDDTRSAMNDSMNHINETEEVVDNIKVVADEIEDGNKGIESVINSCSEHIDEITDAILSSERYYESVSENIDSMKLKITQKSFIFEELTNILDQYPEMIEIIKKRLK